MKCSILILIAVCGLLQISTANSVDTQPLKLKITPSKAAFLPGEIVNFTIEATNTSDQVLEVEDSLSATKDYLKVFIARSDMDFKENRRPQWGTDCSVSNRLNLTPGAWMGCKVSVLCNDKPIHERGLADEVNRKNAEGRILTDYAFPEPGIYYVKARYSVWIVSWKEQITIESAPVRVVIEEPIGEDLGLWNSIQNRIEIAFFMQDEGFGIPAALDAARKGAKSPFEFAMEEIVNRYPRARVATQLGQSLKRFREQVKRAKEIVEQDKIFEEKSKQKGKGSKIDQ